VFEIETTDVFADWFERLRDARGKARIDARLKVIAETGHFGDIRSVGAGVTELRFHFGPGYRVYYTMRGEKLVLLLAGGDKSSQARDIRKAMDMVEES